MKISAAVFPIFSANRAEQRKASAPRSPCASARNPMFKKHYPGQKLLPAEQVFAGAPFLLVFVGGALGGLCGGLAYGLNRKIFTSHLASPIKYLASVLVSGLGVALYM